MAGLNSIAVFCASRPGARPAYLAAARDLGEGLAAAGIRLVYGGGKVGLMGALADAVLAGGGQVTGVIPAFLVAWEVAHAGVQDMIVTETMHARKQIMAERADAFVMLPGGLGTLDEIVEIITWRLLRLHDKPILLCDVEGSSRPLCAAVDTAIAEGLAAEAARTVFEVVEGVPALLQRLQQLSPGAGGRLARA
ncbi:MAG: TIGR00730 family Rossman fold protein [Rhodospirillales bacterium]|nr:TIGR00730 family Rossman fold protein [Rhodospirillales bacterium]